MNLNSNQTKNSKRNKPKEILDLSRPLEGTVSTEFEVSTYDYDALQSTEDAFENDLEYLLQKDKEAFNNATTDLEQNLNNSPTSKSPTKKNKKPNHKAKSLKVGINKITKDVEDIDLSSDETEKIIDKKQKIARKPSSRKLNKKSSINNLSKPKDSNAGSPGTDTSKKKGRLTKKKSKIFKTQETDPTTNETSVDIAFLDKPVEVAVANNRDTSQTMNKKNRTQKRARKMKSKSDLGKISIPETGKGLQENQKVCEEGQEGQEGKIGGDEEKEEGEKEKENEKGEEKEENDDDDDEVINKSLLKKDKASGLEYIDDGKPIKSTSDKTILRGKNNELYSVEDLKNQKIVDQDYTVVDPEAKLSRSQRQRRNKAKRKALEKEKSENSSTEICEEKTESTDSSPIKEAKNSMDLVDNKAVDENPFSIKLRSTSKPMANKKYSSKLPNIDPIKSIIGLSHKQVLNLSLTDVKCKTIVSSRIISKLMKSVLFFGEKYSNDLFQNEDLKIKFLKLCVNIALYESPGYKKVNNEFPVNDFFGHYPELTLDTTGTKLTPPNEAVHQNNFDYSLLSYIGHIVIWAYALQVKAEVKPDLADKYPSLNLSTADIRKSIGGDHLWDQLNRFAGSVNNKRWKHIVKFRENFGFFEDQFVLTLRFMNVDNTIP